MCVFQLVIFKNIEIVSLILIASETRVRPDDLLSPIYLVSLVQRYHYDPLFLIFEVQLPRVKLEDFHIDLFLTVGKGEIFYQLKNVRELPELFRIHSDLVLALRDQDVFLDHNVIYFHELRDPGVREARLLVCFEVQGVPGLAGIFFYHNYCCLDFYVNVSVIF